MSPMMVAGVYDRWYGYMEAGKPAGAVGSKQNSGRKIHYHYQQMSQNLP